MNENSRADRQPEVFHHQIPTATDASPNIELVIAREKLGRDHVGRSWGKRAWRCRGGRAFSRKVGDKFRKFSEQFPVRSTFEAGSGLGVGAALGDPLAQDVC